ncbi:hypothetical protein [Paenibacillus gallinarum]|uniref:YjcZ family sporulation protein n=1 Tax=Paenibacillus gallinarum TaxID=2762232 RepID=A0ABR8SZ09_9BACL|nr:hypothetical protein [Paenibacillus gallinarum]MBD7968752.1 hypothetical protein [Paenibacillus gallinarum]
MNEQYSCYPMNSNYISGYPVSGYERMYQTYGGKWEEPVNSYAMPYCGTPYVHKSPDYLAGILLVLFVLLVIISKTFF